MTPPTPTKAEAVTNSRPAPSPWPAGDSRDAASSARPRRIVAKLTLALAMATLTSCLASTNGPLAYGGTDSQVDVALRTASGDLGCALDKVVVVATLERRYANTATARYVIEGCGERALYVEQCQVGEVTPDLTRQGFHAFDGSLASLVCRYLLVSRVAIPLGGAPAASSAPR
jgi:hypothetical protein